MEWCAPTPWGRLLAEARLRLRAALGDTVLCFHGLPPLLPNAARVVVFVQNRLNLAGDGAGRRGGRTALKRLFFRGLSRNADEFVVQTPSMCRALKRCLGDRACKVLPFLDALPEGGASREAAKAFDFIYVADGNPHKNHRTLLAAWVLLARQGIRPTLVLTLGVRDRGLAEEIEMAARGEGLAIHNAGSVTRQQVFALYRSSHALIYPSTAESFGIPLIEAGALGLPVVASELDYVRDVCTPRETFDPSSAVSLARAVQRFLESPAPVAPPGSAEDFLRGLLEH